LLLPELDEKGRRLVLGAVARAAGDGGVTAVAKLSGASWQTVADGAEELGSGEIAPPGRVRRPGAGRRPLSDADPGLVPALLALVAGSSRGDPGSQPADRVAAAAAAGVLHAGQRQGGRGQAA